MSEINKLEIQFAKALDRLRGALAKKSGSGEAVPDTAMQERVASLEADKSRLLEELVAVRSKRDRDITALDELISQLKPLIEED